MSASAEPLKKPFNLRSLADQTEIRRLVKSCQRNGLVHIHKSKKVAVVPRNKMGT